MNKSIFTALAGKLDGAISSKECALVHEAALMAWDLDNNAVPYGLDLLVTKQAFYRYAAQAHATARKYENNRYMEVPFDGIPLRLWLSVGAGVTLAASRVVACKSTSYRCLRPELVLNALPSSPDYRYLLEQQAALAEVLYFDDMSDDELMEFRRYVRCV
jgi:hypothetical protein